MGKDNEIVLIDSDDEDIKSNKRLRLDTPDLFRFGTPFVEGLTTPRDDSRAEPIGERFHDEPPREVPARQDIHREPCTEKLPRDQQNVPPLGNIADSDQAEEAAKINIQEDSPHYIGQENADFSRDEEDGDNKNVDYDSDDSEILALPSSRAPSGLSQAIDNVNEDGTVDLAENNLGVETYEDSQNSDNSDDTTNSEELLDQVSLGEIPEFPQELIVETRKYLKANGNVKFLEKYLPTTSSAQDIINLIFQLGFVPKINNAANMMELVQTLNRAMLKVKSIRDRLDTMVTIEDAIEKINLSSKILVITGAGISTSIGIPDFRSSKGFYSQIQHLGLTDPQEVFDLENFVMDPSLFYSIAHMIIPPEKIYSPLHAFVKLLQDKGKLLRNYTQNIDNLESYAGIDPEKLIQCHGSFATASCITCGYQVNGEEIFPDIRTKQIPNCPKCIKAKQKLMKNEDNYIPESYGVFKPDITFFGEPLPKIFHDMIIEDLSECDLLISIGTSLKVAPVADIVDRIPPEVPQLLINKDPISHCNFDISLLGYCDDVASYIANKLGDTWDIPHADYDKIRGEGGSNLKVESVDTTYREYEIVNIANLNAANSTEIEEKNEQKVTSNNEADHSSTTTAP